MLLRLSMLFSGLGFWPALLLGGTIFLFALVAFVLSLGSRGDSQKQRQEGGAGDSSDSHECSSITGSYGVALPAFGPAPIVMQNARRLAGHRTAFIS
jgi:hypothetical protein